MHRFFADLLFYSSLLLSVCVCVCRYSLEAQPSEHFVMERNKPRIVQKHRAPLEAGASWCATREIERATESGGSASEVEITRGAHKNTSTEETRIEGEKCSPSLTPPRTPEN